MRTLYPRAIVDEMHQVPFASWDGDRRVWTVPYRSYEALRRRWSRIEAAAIRNEPEERRKRRNQRRGSPDEQAAREGLWRRATTIERDRIIVVEIMAEEIDEAWWRDYRHRLEREFEQESVMIGVTPCQTL